MKFTTDTLPGATLADLRIVNRTHRRALNWFGAINKDLVESGIRTAWDAKYRDENSIYSIVVSTVLALA